MTENTVSSQTLDELDAAVDVDVTRWEPEPGAKLVGTVVGIEYIKTKSGRYMPIVSIHDRSLDVVVEVPAGRAVLARRLESEKVQPGDGLAVKFNGSVTPEGGGNAYFDYRVAVARVGDRGPDVFKVPADDDGLVEDAATENPWTSDQTESGWGSGEQTETAEAQPESEEAPF